MTPRGQEERRSGPMRSLCARQQPLCWLVLSSEPGRTAVQVAAWGLRSGRAEWCQWRPGLQSSEELCSVDLRRAEFARKELEHEHPGGSSEAFWNYFGWGLGWGLAATCQLWWL